MLCFHCQKPAAFEYRWPWNPNPLGVCQNDVETLRKKSSLAGQRMPELIALTAPSSPKPALELDEPGADTKPGLKPQARVAGELPPERDGVVAAISITREKGVLLFTLRRPNQHDFAGPIVELGPTLIALKLLAPPAELAAAPAVPRGAVPQLAHSNPQQMTPPSAAAALAGAGGGPPRERAPVNPPMPHLGAVHRTTGTHQAPPLGASVGAFAPPGGAAPTPPAVRPPGVAPVSPAAPAEGATPDDDDGATDGGSSETSRNVVEGGPGAPPVPP